MGHMRPWRRARAALGLRGRAGIESPAVIEFRKARTAHSFLSQEVRVEVMKRQGEAQS